MSSRGSECFNVGKHRVKLILYRGAICIYCHHGTTKRIPLGIQALPEQVAKNGFLNEKYGTDYQKRNILLDKILEKCRKYYDDAIEQQMPNYALYVESQYKAESEEKSIYNNSLSSLFEIYYKYKNISKKRPNTQKSYKTLHSHIKSFEKTKKINLYNIDNNLSYSFYQFLGETRFEQINVKNKENHELRFRKLGCIKDTTRNRKMADFRNFIKTMSEDFNLNVKSNFYSKAFQVEAKYDEPTVLSMEEISELVKYVPEEKFKKIKDITLLSLVTGANFVDLEKFDKKEIVNKIYHSQRSKTSNNFQMVFGNELFAIVNNYEKISISSQKYNEYLKEMLSNIPIFQVEENGIPKYSLISHKWMRSTFLTTLVSDPEIAISTALALTGHTTPSVWGRYVKKQIEQKDIKVIQNYQKKILNPDKMISKRKKSVRGR
jgi:integrase